MRPGSPCNSQQRSYMKMRQKEHKDKGLTKAEAWAYDFLKHTKYKWNSQCIWRWRIYDFWNAEIGCAVEIDGPEHDLDYDYKRDKSDFERSAIIVLRVRNFNYDDMVMAILKIQKMTKWIDRREEMGLLTKAQKIQKEKLQNEKS